ncbi:MULTISPECIES: sodium/pantothenate symporter [unclassified Sedimentibacter]|uniref:sodium/pantothenate symporter n=1 Tax=unclassified Sedimentibacter TaxID=2649220 RepID=UPI0027DEAFAA|nr:sodium/pantothenate symporter [Sedimentibacter sp. MB35-C1]WMJ78445.1 sodium/pantothenate symporter [Sedimentibacter sp. MB35-C1]
MGYEISASSRTAIIITFAIYTLGMIAIGLYSKKTMDKTAVDKYVDEFYTGGRGMGAIVVAMMVAAGLCSAGTFLGGPGLGYSVGLTWVLAGFSQIFMNFTVFGEIGKKVGIVARRINAQSYVDLFVSRYNSNKFIGVFAILAVMMFLGSYVVAQFVGGARLFESMTGLSYTLGLVLFAGLVLVTAALGGIKGVAAAIVFQGIIMTVSVIMLFILTLSHLGPLTSVYKEIISIDPSVVTPWTWSPMYQFSMWIVYGLVWIGLPHGAMATLTYKDTKSMHKAIIMGVLFVLVWTLALIWTGSLGRAMFPDLEVPDQIIPSIAMKVLPPWLAGLTLAGVAGAIQSTVGSMVIIISSTFVKNAYQSMINPKADSKKLKKVTVMSTVAICIAIFILSINPPNALQFMITFAVGGLGSAFFWPLLLGIYWKRTNEYGAAAGMVGGMVTYILGAGNYLPIAMGMNAVVVALFVSLLLTVSISLATPKPPKGIIMIWFGKYYPKEVLSK